MYKNINCEILNSVSKKLKMSVFHPLKSGIDYLPANGATILEEDILAGIDALLSGWLSSGDYCNKFEKQLSKYFQAFSALLVNSGSSANLLAIATLSSPLLKNRALQPGDEIITVAASFPTTINPIIQYGCIPVFVDISIPDYNIAIDKIEKAITDKTKAIFIAHALGNPIEMSVLQKLAQKYNLWLIEDNCDALGGSFKNKKTGSFGDLSTLSFYPSHQITTGEGGALIVNNNKLHKIARSFRDWGRDCWCDTGCDNTCGKRFDQNQQKLPKNYDHKYTYSHIGYNLKITDVQAALGISQFKRINEIVEQRLQNFNYLQKQLSELSAHIILPKAHKNAEPSWFGFLITLKNSKQKTALVKYLEENKIGTRPFFAGNITKHVAYTNVKYRISENLENTDLVTTNSFWIGCWQGLNQNNLDYISQNIKDFFTKKPVKLA